jgi:uncharacterized cofD-like protein
VNLTELETAMETLSLDPHGPNVVAIGGGHGLAVTLQAVQSYAGAITAVVSVADDGGSSGRLTEDLGIPAPGDIRRCLLALTPHPSLFAELFGYRFGEDTHLGFHSLGNLMLAALTDLMGDFGTAVRLASEMLETVGRVVPASLRPARLSALVGDRLVEGQAAIAGARGGVRKLTVGPVGLEANPEAVTAIHGADQIVIGPGSLYTSVLATLLVPGIAEAVGAVAAAKVFVLNLIDQDGETLGMDGEAHVEALGRLAGVGGPGAIVAHRGPLAVPEGHAPVGVDAVEAAVAGWRLVQADVAAPAGGWPEHDPAKLGTVLAGLAPKK